MPAPNPITWTLDDADTCWAMDVGYTLRLESKRQHRQDSAQRVVGWEAVMRHINGAGGELSTARVMGWDWPALVNAGTHVPDFPAYDTEVKTCSLPLPALSIRRSNWGPNGHLFSWYVLATGDLPTYQLRGCISRDELAEILPGLCEDRHGCKWVPMDRLHPLAWIVHARA